MRSHIPCLRKRLAGIIKTAWLLRGAQCKRERGLGLIQDHSLVDADTVLYKAGTIRATKSAVEGIEAPESNDIPNILGARIRIADTPNYQERDVRIIGAGADDVKTPISTLMDSLLPGDKRD